ncbi:hypothetical protein CN233_36415 [Sinorhizobium meliloti]|nr:hypothetical protein CN233_36415 [Sinorhizobium meliloti]RVK84919.1 hypothetical protein CN152_35535 [Sinorhizobium meliloti]RVN33562.1 hypothetical protein CN113_35880 [Sinorhizobium meliloti]
MTAASMRHCASPCRLYDTDCSSNRAATFRSNSLKTAISIILVTPIGLARLLHDQPWARMLLRIHVSGQPK